jgi:uncharacterized protein with PQ loop repeat
MANYGHWRRSRILHHPLLSFAAQEMLDTGEAGDLSFRMFLILTAGVALWAIHGAMKSDYVIIAANGTSLCLLFGILYFKLSNK